MPLLNFKKCFSQDIRSGKKRQTIRSHKSRDPKPGDILYLYTGLRTKHCKKIGSAICTSVEQIEIDHLNNIFLNGRRLNLAERSYLAIADGFAHPSDIVEFIGRQYGIPFNGLLIKWGGIENEN